MTAAVKLSEPVARAILTVSLVSLIDIKAATVRVYISVMIEYNQAKEKRALGTGRRKRAPMNSDKSDECPFVNCPHSVFTLRGYIWPPTRLLRSVY